MCCFFFASVVKWTLFCGFPLTAPGFPAEVQELPDQRQNLSAGSASLQLREPELRLDIHPEPRCLAGPVVRPGGKHLHLRCAAAGSGQYSQAAWMVFSRVCTVVVNDFPVFTLPPLSHRVQVWQNTSDNLDLSVLNHFAEILRSPR